MNTEFVVESSTQTKNSNFCNKIVNKSTISTPSAFGNVVSEKQTTFYLFTDKQNAVGLKGVLDTSLFDVVEKPFTFVENDVSTDVVLKYLYPKR